MAIVQFNIGSCFYHRNRTPRFCKIHIEGNIRKNRKAIEAIVIPCTTNCFRGVSSESTIHNSRAALTSIVPAATGAEGIGAIGLAMNNEQTIQPSWGSAQFAADDMITVVGTGGICQEVFDGRGRVVIGQQVTAENGWIGLPIGGVPAAGGIAADHPNEVLQDKRGITIAGGITISLIGTIGPGGDMDFVIRCSSRNAILKILEGIGPACTVVGAGGGGIDINDLCRCVTDQQDQRQDDGDELYRCSVHVLLPSICVNGIGQSIGESENAKICPISACVFRVSFGLL